MRDWLIQPPKSVSWSEWFARRAGQKRYVRRLVEKGYVHAALGWAEVLPLGIAESVREKVNSHAPWLNAEALSYRRALCRPTVNGFYCK